VRFFLPRLAVAFLAVLYLAPSIHAQRNDSALSDGEVDQIRESRLVPADSILLFVKFLDLRTQEIHDLYAKPRRPGREQDTHDLMEQFTSIADELSDNLEDYGPRHADIRKALPKVIEATERWATVIKSPPENEAYSVSRKLALETLKDLKDQATQLVDDQAAWFKAHPPSKQQPTQQQNEPITIPR
jgi:hypothetical protein